MVAKFALQFEFAKFKIPDTDLKCFIKFYKNSLLQILWELCDGNKLYCIRNKINKPFKFNLNRQDEVIISRIRIGYTKFSS